MALSTCLYTVLAASMKARVKQLILDSADTGYQNRQMNTKREKNHARTSDLGKDKSTQQP